MWHYCQLAQTKHLPDNISIYIHPLNNKPLYWDPAWKNSWKSKQIHCVSGLAKLQRDITLLAARLECEEVAITLDMSSAPGTKATTIQKLHNIATSPSCLRKGDFLAMTHPCGVSRRCFFCLLLRTTIAILSRFFVTHERGWVCMHTVGRLPWVYLS